MRDVEVVIATIPDREELLQRAIESVVRQTHPVELIRVQLDSIGEGAATTRNKALLQVRTHWVAFLDDDDELLPDHLERCIEAAIEHDADLVYPGMEVIGGNDPTAVAVNGKWVNPFGVTFGPEQEQHLREKGNFIPVTFVARTRLVLSVGGFPQPHSAQWEGRCEDHGLLVKLLDAGAKFHHVPVRTWRYHIHEHNTGGLPRSDK